MLLEFSCGHFRGLHDPQRLRLVASADRSHRERNSVALSGRSLRALKASALFGAAGAGKTTFLQAAAALRYAVTESASWSTTVGLPIGGLAAAPGLSGPTEFEVLVERAGVRYDYGLALTSRGVEREWLVVYPQARPQRWFERERAGDGSEWRWWFGPRFPEEPRRCRALRDSTSGTALFLSTAVAMGCDALLPVFASIADGLRVRVGPDDGDGATSLALMRMPSGRDRMTQFLADFGVPVLGLELGADDGDGVVIVRPGAGGLGMPQRIPMNVESGGVRRLFDLAADLFHVVDTGGTLLIDDLDRGLHPNVTRQLVELFLNQRTNPGGAQIVFTTHDTALLDQALLRRDQVWFMEEGIDGRRRLYPLLEFSPRRDEALARGYERGRYGAVPLLRARSV
jgi:energy-coupling factor transporter ATP-binding protein EcfA2